MTELTSLIKGMHLLELAKSAWNKIVISPHLSEVAEAVLKQQARVFLALSSRILTILGPEGDKDGPLQEIETLKRLLNE